MLMSRDVLSEMYIPGATNAMRSIEFLHLNAMRYLSLVRTWTVSLKRAGSSRFSVTSFRSDRNFVI